MRPKTISAASASAAGTRVLRSAQPSPRSLPPERVTSPIGAFLRERCEVGPAYSVGVDDLFEAWVPSGIGRKL